MHKRPYNDIFQVGQVPPSSPKPDGADECQTPRNIKQNEPITNCGSPTRLTLSDRPLITQNWLCSASTCQKWFQTITTRSLAVAKRPCDCCVGQFWPNRTGRRYFAD